MQTGSMLAPGMILGDDFEVVRLLGSGGMGTVYVAAQKSTGKLRALKVMHRDIVQTEGMQRRFEQEARVGARIRSGHVVEVVAAGVDRETGLPYLVMELLEGTDLRIHLQRAGALPMAEVRRILEQLCHGIGAAHAAGVVHRDLKPENIFLARPNQAGSATSVVKVLDFGIAKLASEAGTQGTAAVGSPLWMAPEQTEPGPVTPAADVWALGLIVFELLTGEPFWRAARLKDATPMHLLREIVLAPIPPASERGGSRLPHGFDAWFARCVVRDPAARFPDANRLWMALKEVLGPATLVVSPSDRPAAQGPEIFAATQADDRALAMGSAPPPAHTPLVIVATPSNLADAATARSPSARAPSSRVALGVAALVALAGLSGGFALSRRPREVPVAATVQAPSPVPVAIPAPPPAIQDVPTSPPEIAPTEPPAPPVPPRKKAVGAESPDAPARATPSTVDGFGDPHDEARMSRDGRPPSPYLATVQGHHVRLFTRLVSNGSNVADGVVRKAVEWSSWQYQRCYEQTFAASKDLVGGTVTVAFDILDQLPRHAALEGPSFGNAAMDRCVVQTLSGQTINAAGAQGAGHVVYAFKFVVMN